MQLVNTTPIPARLEAAEVEGTAPRIGMLTAKATFRFDLGGRVELETQEPFPLFAEDQETPLGLLPSDAEPRRDEAFEVILLGHAYAPGGHPAEQLVAALTVGSVRRELLVTGDRVWVQTGQGPVITKPVPFTKCALSWERAFGGSHPAQLDANTVFDVSDPINPRGRGFDAEGRAKAIADTLRAPPGYPKLADYQRRLPNLEDPRARVTHPADGPEPVCWATAPRDVVVSVLRHARQQAEEGHAHSHPIESESLPDTVPSAEHVLRRAHPDWVIPVPREAPRLRLEHLTAERPTLDLQLAPMHLVGDYTVEGRQGQRPLNPIVLVLLPDERRFYVLYTTAFTFPFHPGDDRGFRLRIAEGWYPGGPSC